MKFLRSFFVALGILVAIFVIFFAGMTVGSALTTEESPTNHTLAAQMDTIDMSAFWEVWEELEESFVPTNDTPLPTTEERIWGAIQGLTATYGDPYTVFFPPVEAEIFREEIDGNFSGVGMEIGIQNDVLTVIAPLKNTPAENAGILPGDIIVSIDGTPSLTMSVDEAVQRIRGEQGTVVVLGIIREQNAEAEPLEISITRDIIEIPIIETEVVDDVFVIRLFNFSGNVDAQLRDALRSFVASGNDKLIIDVRSNPGGFLSSAIEAASWFLPAGKTVLREIVDADAQETDENTLRSRGYNIIDGDTQMVILVDGGSASASEIFAGALQEHGVAHLLGTQTFGKGSVQELIPITGETSLKITIARWLTPNGVSLSDTGLTPDSIVEFDLDAFLNENRDTQFEAALELLGAR